MEHQLDKQDEPDIARAAISPFPQQTDDNMKVQSPRSGGQATQPPNAMTSDARPLQEVNRSGDMVASEPEKSLVHTPGQLVQAAQLEGNSHAPAIKDNVNSNTANFGPSTVVEAEVAGKQLSKTAPDSPPDNLSEKSEHSKPYAKFTLFPKLPTELRWKIWKHAMTTSRYVIIRSKWNWEAYLHWNSAHTDDTLECTISTPKNPSVFRACRESWQAAQEIYKPLVVEQNPDAIEKLGPGPKIKFRCQSQTRWNSEDWVIIGRQGLKFIDRILNQFRIQALQRLALSTKTLLTTAQLHSICGSIKHSCPSLQWLGFTVGAGPQSKREELPDVGMTKVDSDLTDLVHFRMQRRKDGRRGWTEYLALKEQADKIKRDFDTFVEDYAPEWRDLDSGVYFWGKVKKAGSKGQKGVVVIRWESSHSGYGIEVTIQANKASSRMSRYDGIRRLFRENPEHLESSVKS